MKIKGNQLLLPLDDLIERSLHLPGKLERERGLPAARLAVEQRYARILREHNVKHLKRLCATHEIMRWRRKKDPGRPRSF